MGIPKHLEERVARLEARVKYLPDPEAERERKRVVELHANTWLVEGSLEDIPEKDRDQELWGHYCKYSPVILRMIWEGNLEGRDELLAAGVDFTRAEGIDEDDVRDYINSTSGSNTPHEP